MHTRRHRYMPHDLEERQENNWEHPGILYTYSTGFKTSFGNGLSPSNHKSQPVSASINNRYNYRINMTLDPKLLTGLGCAASMFLCAAGSAYASSHSGVYAMRSSGLKGFAPIVISGVLAIYGIIVSVLLALKFTGGDNNSMTEEEGYRNLSAGLAVGFACLASGFGMATFIKELNLRHYSPAGTVAPAPQRSNAEPLLDGQLQRDCTSIGDGSADDPTRPKPVNFIYLCLCLCFLEAIGLYGLIVALFLMA